MANILLVNYPGYPRYLSCLMPDNGLASLAAVLLAHNHTVIIRDYSNIEYIEQVTAPLKGPISKLDLQLGHITVKNLQAINGLFVKSLKQTELSILKELYNVIQKENIDVVGFKLWWGRGSIISIEWARKIKVCCHGVRTVGGGPQATIFREQMYEILEMDHIDAIFLGEAEHLFCEYLSMLEKGNETSFSHESVVTALNKKEKRPCNLTVQDRQVLPMPVYDRSVYPSLRPDNQLYIFLIEDSIGCPNHCAFCNRSWMHVGRDLRSAESIWRQVEYLNQKYHATLFKFAGANTPAKLFKELLESQPLYSSAYRFICFGEFESYKPDNVSNAHQLGVISMFFGLESASPKLLRDAYNKIFNPDKALEITRACRKTGIHTAVSLIYPGPWETKQSRDKTLEWLNRAEPNSVMVQIPSVFYGTKWYHSYKKYNFIMNCSDPIRRLLYQDYHDTFYTPFVNENAPPFLVNGWTWDMTFMKFLEFAKEVQKAFPVCTEDYLACADFAGYSGKVREFENLVQKALYGGDVDILRSLVLKINSNILNRSVINY